MDGPSRDGWTFTWFTVLFQICTHGGKPEVNRHGDGKGKSNTTEAGEDEKVDITCVEGEAGRAH